MNIRTVCYLQAIEKQDRIDYYKAVLDKLESIANVDDAYALLKGDKFIDIMRNAWLHSLNKLESNGYDKLDSAIANDLLKAIYTRIS